MLWHLIHECNPSCGRSLQSLLSAPEEQTAVRAGGELSSHMAVSNILVWKAAASVLPVVFLASDSPLSCSGILAVAQSWDPSAARCGEAGGSRSVGNDEKHKLAQCWCCSPHQPPDSTWLQSWSQHLQLQGSCPGMFLAQTQAHPRDGGSHAPTFCYHHCPGTETFGYCCPGPDRPAGHSLVL